LTAAGEVNKSGFLHIFSPLLPAVSVFESTVRLVGWIRVSNYEYKNNIGEIIYLVRLV